MNVELLLAFVTASALLVAIPGPNVALIVSNTLTHGLRFGLATVAGTASAIALQLMVVIFSAGLLTADAGGALEVLRALGVAYLLWLALAAWRARPEELGDNPSPPRPLMAIAGGGFVVGLSNPKTWLFYGAFFPQFIDASGDVPGQFRVLALTFFVVTSVLDGAWALCAARLRGLLLISGRLRNRLTALVLLLVAVGLLLARTSPHAAG